MPNYVQTVNTGLQLTAPTPSVDEVEKSDYTLLDAGMALAQTAADLYKDKQRADAINARYAAKAAAEEMESSLYSKYALDVQKVSNSYAQGRISLEEVGIRENAITKDYLTQYGNILDPNKLSQIAKNQIGGNSDETFYQLKEDSIKQDIARKREYYKSLRDTYKVLGNLTDTQIGNIYDNTKHSVQELRRAQEELAALDPNDAVSRQALEKKIQKNGISLSSLEFMSDVDTLMRQAYVGNKDIVNFEAFKGALISKSISHGMTPQQAVIVTEQLLEDQGYGTMLRQAVALQNAEDDQSKKYKERLQTQVDTMKLAKEKDLMMSYPLIRTLSALPSEMRGSVLEDPNVSSFATMVALSSTSTDNLGSTPLPNGANFAQFGTNLYTGNKNIINKGSNTPEDNAVFLNTFNTLAESSQIVGGNTKDRAAVQNIDTMLSDFSGDKIFKVRKDLMNTPVGKRSEENYANLLLGKVATLVGQEAALNKDNIRYDNKSGKFVLVSDVAMTDAMHKNAVRELNRVLGNVKFTNDEITPEVFSSSVAKYYDIPMLSSEESDRVIEEDEWDLTTVLRSIGTNAARAYSWTNEAIQDTTKKVLRGIEKSTKTVEDAYTEEDRNLEKYIRDSDDPAGVILEAMIGSTKDSTNKKA